MSLRYVTIGQYTASKSPRYIFENRCPLLYRFILAAMPLIRLLGY